MAAPQIKESYFFQPPPSNEPSFLILQGEERKAALDASQSTSFDLKTKKKDLAPQQDLFPNAKPPSLLLKTEEAKVDFNRNVWSSSPPDHTQIEAVRPKLEKTVEDPLLSFPKVGAYYLAQAVGKSYDLHLTMQKNTLEVLDGIREGMHKLREKQLELSKEALKNQASTWKSYLPSWMQSLIPCLSHMSLIASCAFGIQALFAGQFALGAWAIGSFLSFLTGKLLNQFTDYKRVANAFLALATVVSIHTIKERFATIFVRSLPFACAKGLKIGHFLFQQVAHYREQKVAITNYRIQAKKVLHDFENKQTEQKIDETIRDFGDKSPAQMIAATTKAIEDEARMKSQLVSREKM